jgi:hypothetical protein
MMLVGVTPSLPWSDIALGDDNRLYMLVSGDLVSCWWCDCDTIWEYVSDDEGSTWALSGRTWTSDEYIGDAGYVRDELGHIKREAVALVAVVTPTFNPMDAPWHLKWFADPGVQFPVSFLYEPGWMAPRARRHLTGR